MHKRYWGSGVFVEGDLGRPAATKLPIWQLPVFVFIDLPAARLVSVTRCPTTDTTRYDRYAPSVAADDDDVGGVHRCDG